MAIVPGRYTTDGGGYEYTPQDPEDTQDPEQDPGRDSGDGKFLGEDNTKDGQGEGEPGAEPGAGTDPKEVKWTRTSTFNDPQTGDVVDIYEDEDGNEKEVIRRKGTTLRDAEQLAEAAAEEKRLAGQSAYDIVKEEFSKYGLGSLVETLRDLIVKGTSQAEFTMELRKSPEYAKRFAGNAQRVAAGLKALDEATYTELEDQYQTVMRNYGLPESYWAKDSIGTQAGFTNLIAGDVSAPELESRIQQASDVIDKGPKEYIDAIKQFYPDIQRGDLMAYVLDPKNGIKQIESKIGAAKIGGEYLRAGLGAGSIDMRNAEELQRQGVTAEKARLGAQAIKETAPRGGQLSSLYGQGAYGMEDVEAEVYGLGNAAESKRKREKISEMEQASFAKQTGNISTALSRNTSY